MKAINDKIRDLRANKKRLEKEKKELISKAEALKPELERKRNSFSNWNTLLGVCWTLIIIVAVCGLFGIFIVPFFFLSGSFWDMGMGLLVYIVALLIIIFLGLIFVSCVHNKVQVKYAELHTVSAKLAEIQSRIDEIEHSFVQINEAQAELKVERKMSLKGLVPFIDRHGSKRFGTPKEVRKWKIMDMDMKNRFSRLKPREFEKLIRELFVKMGYETHLTPYTADFGADIVVKRGSDTIVIQVKKYSRENRVGSPEVQRLLGSMFKYEANKAIFITTSDFTDEAREQSKGAPIELWNHTILNEKIEQYLLNL
jgi:low affinity Fe/Cu permease